MYHNIGIPPKETGLRGLYVTPRMFRFQMRCLKASGFRVVPLKEILSFVRGDIVHENLAAITFDDGYQDFFDNAYPVLKEHGYPSTVFLVSDLVGRENLWDHPKVHARKKLMDWETIFRLRKEGIIFGSHTRTHPFLSKLPPQHVVDEIKNSKVFLENRLQTPAEFFCYPYGDYNKELIHVVKESGYIGAFTIRRGLVHRDDNPYEIRRSLIRYSTNPLLFALRLYSNYEDRRNRGKMNILLMSISNRHWGGIESYTDVLISTLLEKGHKMVVCTLTDDAFFTLKSSGVQVNMTRIRIENSADIFAILKIVRLSIKEKVDLIIAQQGKHYWPAALAARISHVPVIFIRHQTVRLKRSTCWLINRGVEAILAVSDAVKSSLIAAGVLNNKIKIIHNCVSLNRFNPLKIDAYAVRKELGINPPDFIVGAFRQT